MSSNERKPLVSIKCTVYNHEPYLRQCLDGFVMQKTDFAFEAIVHDDASTDKSAEIIREYAEKYPDIIKPIYETENQYSKRDGSLRRIMNEAIHPDAKYIALCEGDDYWTDPYKLQKQVVFLETHPDYILSHSDINHEFVKENKIISKLHKHMNNYNQINKSWNKAKMVELILSGKYSVQTLSVCAKKEVIFEIQKDKDINDAKLKMGDTPLWIELSQRGKFHYLKEATATYHIIPESATHSKNYSNVISFFESCLKMIDLFGNRYSLSKEFVNSVKQTYIYFSLREVYTSKKEYLGEIKEKLIDGTNLDLRNKILISTLNYNKFAKKLILYSIKFCDKVKSNLGFYIEHIR